MLDNIRAVLRDKSVSGLSILASSYFTLWGLWNLYYYPHLGQSLSYYGALSLVIANTVYIALLLYYSNKKLNSGKMCKTSHSFNDLKILRYEPETSIEISSNLVVNLEAKKAGIFWDDTVITFNGHIKIASDERELFADELKNIFDRYDVDSNMQQVILEG